MIEFASMITCFNFLLERVHPPLLSVIDSSIMPGKNLADTSRNPWLESSQPPTLPLPPTRQTSHVCAKLLTSGRTGRREGTNKLRGLLRISHA
jgi:hypothetical protein